MAEEVSITAETMFAELGRLHMEVRKRAEREDSLVALVKNLQAQIAELRSQPEEIVEEPPKRVRK